jgi:hypothetical protein
METARFRQVANAVQSLSLAYLPSGDLVPWLIFLA